MGIFRLPGQARRVQTLKELYDQGQDSWREREGEREREGGREGGRPRYWHI